MCCITRHTIDSERASVKIKPPSCYGINAADEIIMKSESART